MTRKKIAILVIAILTAVGLGIIQSSPASAVSTPSLPAIGQKFENPPAGQVYTYTTVGATTTKTVSTGSADAAMVSAQAKAPSTEMVQIATIRGISVPLAKQHLNAPASVGPPLYPPRCYSITVSYGSSSLWAKMHQDWCWNGSYLTYWPGGHCYGGDSIWWPGKKYIGCNDPPYHEYGVYWNQGRSWFDADLCSIWQPGTGPCYVHTYVHQIWVYTASGTWYRAL